MTESKGKFLGELRLGHPLAGQTQIVTRGLLILCGILLLLSDSTLNEMGPQSFLAGLFGFFVLGLTLLSAVEMLEGSGERGGTYALVHETLGGMIAFLTGWAQLAGNIVLVAALSQLATRLILSLWPNLAIKPEWAALGLFFTLLLIEVLQLLPQRARFGWLLAVLPALFLVSALAVIPQFKLDRYQAAPAADLSALNHSVALFSIGFLAFESLLISRSQIRDAKRALPSAILWVWALGTIGSALILFILGGLSPQPATGELTLITGLTQNSLLLPFVVEALILVLLAIAAHRGIMTAARQLHSFSMQGAFPQVLRRVFPPLPMPPLLFAALGALGAPLILWVPYDSLVLFGAGLYLLVMLVLNVAAIYSQRVEPDRRRSFEVPYFPLIPALAIAGVLILFRQLFGEIWLGLAVWLVMGIGFYIVYAQHNILEAQEGEVVFGHPEHKSRREDAFRILVPIGEDEERRSILQVAVSLAHQLDGEVIPLQVIAMPDPLAIEESRRVAEARNELFRWSTRVAEDERVPLFPITRLARTPSDGIIDTVVEEDCKLVLMAWPMKHTGGEARIGSVLGTVVREAPCDVAVIAYRTRRTADDIDENGDLVQDTEPRDHNQGLKKPLNVNPKRILVPTSGGPNAPLAIRLALLLTREYQSVIETVYIIHPDATEEEIEGGHERIRQTIAAMRSQAYDLPGKTSADRTSEIRIDGKVIQASTPLEGIIDASQDYDLVLMGSSEESMIDQVFFGTIAEQVASRSPTPVAIVKRYKGLPRLWLARAWNTLYESLPQLDVEEQIEIYRDIHRGARPDVDFFVMIGLSTLIATFGLLQNSTAVIIGAMLVAPLFSPLLALSLSIIQGNVRLLRVATESMVKGIALSIGLAALLTSIAPVPALTPQILLRSEPNLLDLAVALASGMAGAYAVARKDVAAALPGVAIAAALVPPLGVIGIGLAVGDLSVAGGSTLLFATNLIAIALAGSLTFLLLGFRPGARGIRELHLRRGLTTTLLLFVLISIPLAAIFTQSVRSAAMKQSVINTLQDGVSEYTDIEIANPDDVSISVKEGVWQIDAPLFVKGNLPAELASNLEQSLSSKLNRPVRVRLILYQVVEAAQ